MSLFVVSVFVAHAAPLNIANGDTTTDFEAVGALTTEIDGDDQMVCTATLIAPQWALTAAHCSEAAEGYSATNDVSVILTSDIADSAVLIERALVDGFYADPDYSPMDLEHDVGLLHLADPMSTTPYSLSEETPSDAWLGEYIEAVGFGFSTYDGGDAGVKRVGSLPIYQVDEKLIFTYEEGGSNLCTGDSGGPALLSVDKDYEVVGLATFAFSMETGGDPCADGGGGFARLDASRAWIDATMAIDDETDDETDTTDDETDTTVDDETETTDETEATDETDDTTVDVDTGELEEEDTGVTVEDGSKGCSSVPGSGFAPGGLLLLVLGFTRRRETNA